MHGSCRRADRLMILKITHRCKARQPPEWAFRRLSCFTAQTHLAVIPRNLQNLPFILLLWVLISGSIPRLPPILVPSMTCHRRWGPMASPYNEQSSFPLHLPYLITLPGRVGAESLAPVC